ncbi:MAG: hypothetical protein BWY60_00466 [Actinobacteria bacterium ADurb.Bin346]|nr:MAG: hypothetical protein BWY60_00466 [Actinobacteria bacterium ADurb.Bin346]
MAAAVSVTADVSAGKAASSDVAEALSAGSALCSLFEETAFFMSTKEKNTATIANNVIRVIVTAFIFIRMSFYCFYS